MEETRSKRNYKRKTSRAGNEGRVKDGFMEYSRSNPNILPSPAVLESYEEVAPGSVEQIVEMAKLEQKHRHRWENLYLKSITYSTRMGQILGFALAAIILYLTLHFAYDNRFYLSAITCITGFAFLTVVSSLAYKFVPSYYVKKATSFNRNRGGRQIRRPRNK